jgi:mannose-6-phosphate isomerase-like protein (cupin superfamily)
MTETYQPPARHTTAGTGEAYWFFDSLMVIRADQPGQPVIIEATVAPGGGAPLHAHADLDDSFYLVSGRLAMRCGQQAFAVSPGDYVALPHGVPHTFRVMGDEPAVMLQVHADDSFLRFIRAVGQPAASRTLPPGMVLATGMEEALEVAAQTGQPVIGPPMSEEEAAAALSFSLRRDQPGTGSAGR